VVTLKTADQIAKMREAGKIVATMLAATREAVKPGVTTAELDRIAADVLARAGAIVDGWHADAAITVPVGRISPEAEKLIAVTGEALERGIAAAKVGNRLGDIGATVQQYVESQGFSVVRNYVGHGIGRAMHEDPQVPNYGTADLGRVIKEGLCIAIEPMVNIGGIATRVLEDNWTVVTEDGSLSAHFEHTLACLADGPVVLTRDAGAAEPGRAATGRTKDAAPMVSA
jgi:methionyl aminopeptidase